jgi:cytochrome b pre-mRNA-processing protein 3
MPLLRRPPKTSIAALYGAIVAQARRDCFYEAYGVPDTVLGRFDMIVLHLVLLLRRLREGEAAHRELAQGVFDTFCRDMDHNLREMGISDPGIPKQMKRVGEAFYGRAQAYEVALAEASDAALISALSRNVYAAEQPVAAMALATYVRQATRALSAQEFGALTKGEVSFPVPSALATTGSLA